DSWAASEPEPPESAPASADTAQSGSAPSRSPSQSSSVPSPHFASVPAVAVHTYSQPFEASPSRSTKPVVHDATPQIAALHSPVPFAGTHATPHPPQFDGSVWNPAFAYSQPSLGTPLQSLNPDGQVST